MSEKPIICGPCRIVSAVSSQIRCPASTAAKNTAMRPMPTMNCVYCLGRFRFSSVASSSIMIGFWLHMHADAIVYRGLAGRTIRNKCATPSPFAFTLIPPPAGTHLTAPASTISLP